MYLHGRSNEAGVGMVTGTTVRRYRELRGMSQGELAARLGVSRQAVNGGETGAVLRPRWFPAAAELLRIPDETWMTEDEMLVKIGELADHLLLARTARRDGEPLTYGSYGTGRPVPRAS